LRSGGALVAAGAPTPAAEAEPLGVLHAVLRAVERLASRKPPDVVVHVPEQPAPVVNVTVEQPKPRAVRVEVDADGVKRYVPEEA
jgi:hypothetical protein